MPLHVKRLIIVFVVFISGSLIIRYFLVPESFGELGHYRALSLKENENRDIKYVGSGLCIECHEDIGELKNTGFHVQVTCETCHGPGFAHCEEPEGSNIDKPTGREFCGKCHAQNAARDKNQITQVVLAEHNTGEDCISCHNPHEPWKEIE